MIEGEEEGRIRFEDPMQSYILVLLVILIFCTIASRSSNGVGGAYCNNAKEAMMTVEIDFIAFEGEFIVCADKGVSSYRITLEYPVKFEEAKTLVMEITEFMQKHGLSKVTIERSFQWSKKEPRVSIGYQYQVFTNRNPVAAPPRATIAEAMEAAASEYFKQ